MKSRKKFSTAGLIFIFFFLLCTAQIINAQSFREYYPLHVGDYWVQHVDSAYGSDIPATFRIEIEGTDVIQGKQYFRMKQHLIPEDQGYEDSKWYVWLREDTSGIILGAFGDSSTIVELNIPTANIIVDGDPGDWIGISAFVTDPQGDDSPTYVGDDIRALYVAQDANHLFIRMDLWDDVNTNFQNSPMPFEGKYTIRIDNDGPYDYMELGIAYDSNLSQWSLGYNYSSWGVPPGLEGPDYVGVRGKTIEVKLPFYLMGKPSQYYEISGEVDNYSYQYGSILDEIQGEITEIYDPPIQYFENDMLIPGYQWEFDAPDMGGHFIITLEGLSETVQVPAGTFDNCVKFRETIVDEYGDTTQYIDVYYAKGVGEVLKIGWSNWLENMKFELVEYSVQSIQVNVANSAQAGQNVNLSVSSSQQNFQPTTHILFYRNAGEKNWNSLPMNTAGSNLNVTIPQQAVTIRGVEYYVYLSDGLQEITYPALDPETNPAIIQVTVDNYKPPLVLEGMTYKMISIPLELNNAQILDVFLDDYGQYDPKRWRVFRWQNGDYVEYPNITTNFTPGTALWLVTFYGETFDVDSALSINSSQPYTTTLSPGWNQVANPFAFPVSSDTVQKPNNVLEPPVFYDGIDYQYDIPVLQPWQGYFVYNTSTSPVTVSVPPIAAEISLIKSRSRMDINTENEYLLQLSAEMPGTKLMDTQNYVGLRTNAVEERDGLDFAEAPPIGDHIQLSIIENEERFAGNFKPTQGEGHQWELEVVTSLQIDRPVQVCLHETGKLLGDSRLYILDRDYNCSVPIQDKKFNVDFTKDFSIRHLKILIGTQEYAQKNNEGIPLIPFEYRLEQNFPNPFNSGTTIQYQLAKRSHVILEIYNMLGQRIRSLTNGTENTGQHTIIWNGLDDTDNSVASGIYLYCLKTDHFSTTRKLILIK